jgi:hypothetical protein
LSRKLPSRFPKVTSAPARVSARVPKSELTLDAGGRNDAEGNEVPGIMSPTPAITILLAVVSEMQEASGFLPGIAKIPAG